MGTANPTTGKKADQTAPGASTTQGAMVEPRPRAEQAGQSDEIFLSPRVLDAGAFARYTEMLKTIIAQASAQARTLEDYSADAEAMVGRCNESGETINKRLQAGVRMIKMIDERAERTERLLERAQEIYPDTDTLSAQIEQMVEERLSASHHRLNQIVTSAEIRAEVAEKRARDAIALSEEHAAKLTKLAQAVENQLTALDEKIEDSRATSASAITEIKQQAQSLRREFEVQVQDTRAVGESMAAEARQRLESASRELEERIDGARSVTDHAISEIKRSADTVHERTDAAVERAVERARETGAHLNTRMDEAVRATEERIADLSKTMAPVLETAAQAMRALGMDPQNPVYEDSPLARIEQLVERGETQLASLDRVYRQLVELQNQAEGVRTSFGAWLVDAASTVDSLEARKDLITGPLHDAAKTINMIGPDLDHKLEMASTKLTHLQTEQEALRKAIQSSSAVAGDVREQLSNQAGQLQALLDGSLNMLSTRVEQAGMWLGNLIQRADTIGASLRGQSRMQFGSEPATQNQTQGPAHAQSPVMGSAPTSEHQPGAQPSDQTGAQPPSRDVQKLVGSFEADMPRPPNPFEGQQTPQATPQETQQPHQTPLPAPRPLQRPIDAISFDDATNVIKHQQDDGENGATRAS